MIKSMEVVNFKCFDKLSVELTNLNVFTGINNMGKSTTIQSILLLRQSFEIDSTLKGIYLNGEYVSLGIGKDLLNKYASNDEILIKIKDEDVENNINICYLAQSDYLSNSNYNSFNKNMNIFINNLTYISAERIGPKRFYEYSYQKINDKKNLGSKGELWVGYLSENGYTERVNDKIVFDNESNLLIYQTQYWLSRITPGIKLNIEKNNVSGIVNLGYCDENFSPMNVGFGISYVAPIIVSLLKAKKDDIVIIENPEAHLHPKGQRILGELVCLVASTGVQVFLETHSDHVINGIRISVKNNIISNKNIIINYYYQKKIESENKIARYKHCKCSPLILDNGKLSDWPEGFFDEWDKALEELI